MKIDGNYSFRSVPFWSERRGRTRQWNRIYMFMITYGNSSASGPGKLIRGDNGERCFFSISCSPGGAWTGLKMVNLRFGGAKNPPDSVSWVRILFDVDNDADRMPSIVSADLEIKMEADCCNPPFEYSVVKLWWSSSICCDVLRIHFSVLPEMMDIPPAALSVDECADVERTNWRTCFCCAVKNVAPCDDAVESGCCKKLVNLLFVPLADVELLLLVVVVCWVLENFCTCFSVTIFMLDWALSCCINNVLDTLWSHVDTLAVDDDCKLWLRVLCAFVVLTVVAVDWPVAVVVVDDLSSSSSFFSSPGAVTMYCGGSVSSTDIFSHALASLTRRLNCYAVKSWD